MRKSISVALFSMVSTLLVLGIAVMGCSEWVLFGRYFAQERYEALDGVADVARRTADYVVQNASLPEGEELEVLNARLEIIGESAEACLFFTDPEGRVMLSSSSSQVVGTQVPLALFDEVEPQGSYHLLSNLEGVLVEKSYVSVSQMRDADGQRSGYLFLCSSGARLEDFRDEFFSNFFLSACLMLLFANIACGLLMRRITVPLQRSAMRPSASAAETWRSGWRGSPGKARSQTWPAPLTRWRRISRPRTTPAGSSWATSPTSCAPP